MPTIQKDVGIFFLRDMKLTTALRYNTAKLLRQSADLLTRVPSGWKSGGISLIAPWITKSFLVPSWNSLVHEGYRKNSVFFAAVRTLAFSFPAPPLMVYADDSDSAEPLPNHPLRRLLASPNPDQGEVMMRAAAIVWMAIGGSVYIHKERNARGQVIALRTYHDGNITVVPAADPNSDSWISHYVFTGRDGVQTVIPRDDIIHVQWPTPDALQPWMSQPPLLAVARELDADNEASRYVATLLANDAMPRTIITPSADSGLTPDEKARVRDLFVARHGGSNRGGVEVIDFGAKIERLSLDMDELSFAALHDISEQRICAALGVPPSVAGLGDDPTYSNAEEAHYRYTVDTLAPLWRLFESQIQSQLVPDFGGDIYVRHDLSRVAAFREDVDAKAVRTYSGYQAGLIGFREARAAIGLNPDPEPNELFLVNGTSLLLPLAEVVAGSLMPQQITTIEQQPEPAKALAKPETKALSRAQAQRQMTRLQRYRMRIARQLEREVQAFFDDLAKTVASRARSRKADEMPSIEELLEDDDWLDLTNTLKSYTIDLLELSWEPWNALLGADIAFELSDPAVVRATANSAQQVTGIAETTRAAIRDVLKTGTEEGWTIWQLVNGVDGQPGLLQTVAQTYKNRARTIARTELGTAQNIAAGERFSAMGVQHVEIFDGGSDDSDEDCNQLNGAIKSLAWFKANPLGHPNCVRAAGPHYPEDE